MGADLALDRDGSYGSGTMTDPVSSIRNLGPAMEASFARVGITTADQLRDLGCDASYAKLLATGTRPHFIMYYVIEMGLQGRPWNDCKGKEKTELRKRFDALVAAHHDKGKVGIERILDEIGVIDPKTE